MSIRKASVICAISVLKISGINGKVLKGIAGKKGLSAIKWNLINREGGVDERRDNVARCF